MSRAPLSRRGHGRPLFHLMMSTLMVALVWLAGLFFFAETLPTAPEQPDRHTDALVVFTGGSGRVDAGLDLLTAGRAERLFVSGVYRGVDVKTLMQTFHRDARGLAERIEIGTAEDTIANAQETAEWFRARGYESLRLITGAYHMPRALLEFRHHMPNADIVSHPVFPEHVKQDEWWAWPGTAMLVVGEYTKFLLAWTRHKALDLFAAQAQGERP